MKSYNKNSKKYDLINLSEIDIYKLILAGEMRKFPQYFWECRDSDTYSPKIIRYLMEDILNWDIEDVKTNLRKNTFKDNKLAGMLFLKYDDSPYKAITSAYPERNYKPWDFVNTPNKYWQGEEGKKNGAEAIIWLLEEEFMWSMDDIKEKVNHQVFIENNLLGMIKKAFNSSLFEAIDYTYPGKFKRWELGEHVKNDYWTKEEGILATKWLIETKLKWTEDDIKKSFNKQIFADNDLYGMIQRCFNSSPYEALNTAYPGEFYAWEIPSVPLSFWSEENCIQAFIWLIDEKLKIGKGEEIRGKISKEIMIENGLCIPHERYGIKRLIKLYNEHQ